MTAPMLAIEGLRTGYGGTTIIHDLDLTVGAGEIVALIGANGAGKSTLAKAISGLLPAGRGRIHLAGDPIEGLSARERVRRGVAQVPEGRQIIAGLTVAENLRLGAYLQRRRLGEAGMAERIETVCRHFPVLLERLHGTAGNLSGGQQQMLAIARALMSAPRVLVLDEPSLGLSPALVAEIFRLIETLRAQGLAILLSEQNARMSLAIADRGVVIEMGRVALQGPARELLDRAEVAERYLGVGGRGAEGEGAQARHAALVQGLGRVLAG
jgi:branched-chain amino acid transport system ATP-binding protein